MMTLTVQIVYLFVLGIPVACVAWTVTHEEVLRESRQYCQEESSRARSLARRKFFYLFTCEYCFSHYVAAAILIITRYRLLFPDWRGYLVAFFTLVCGGDDHVRRFVGELGAASCNAASASAKGY